MDDKSFLNGLRYPGNLNESNLQELRRLRKQYPFCASVHLLLLKTLNNTNNNEYDNELKAASPFIHDRMHAYQWVQTPHKAVQGENKAVEKKHRKGMTDMEKEMHYQASLRQSEKDQDFLEPQTATRHSEAGNENQKAQLIERFVQQQPTIKAQKDKSYEEEEQWAERSIEDNLDMVSDTLATVYEKQGKIKKAIQVYEKLNLRFPEKGDYFANRIKALKTKLGSK